MKKTPKPTLAQKIAFITAAHQLEESLNDGYTLDTRISDNCYELVLFHKAELISTCEKFEMAFFSHFSKTEKLTDKQNEAAIQKCVSAVMNELKKLNGLKD